MGLIGQHDYDRKEGPDFKNADLPVQKPCFERMGFMRSDYFGQQ